MLGLVFTSLDKDSVIHNYNTSPSYSEQIILKIRSGSDKPKPGFVGSRPGSGQTSQGNALPDTGQETNTGSTPGNGKGVPGPRFPWGADPRYGRSGSCEASGPHSPRS